MGVRAVTSRPGESVADVIAALTRELHELEAEVADKETRWLELSEIIE